MLNFWKNNFIFIKFSHTKNYIIYNKYFWCFLGKWWTCSEFKTLPNYKLRRNLGSTWSSTSRSIKSIRHSRNGFATNGHHILANAMSFGWWNFFFIFLSICLEKYSTYNFTSFYSFKGLWSRRRFDYSSPCHPNNNVTYVIWSTSKISKLATTSNTFRYEFSYVVMGRVKQNFRVCNQSCPF